MVDLYCILQETDLDLLLARAAEKDPGFDLYWFAVACQRVSSLPNEIGSWGVQLLIPIDAASVKARFEAIADEVMMRIGKMPP